MHSKQIHRILRDAQAPELLETLTERISLSDLQALLLDLYRQKAQAISPSMLLRNYQQNRFVQTAQVAPDLQMDFDHLAFRLLPDGFEALELSPVAPLASSSAIAPVHQNNVLTTIRATEVSSDPTNVLALECAVRRKNALAKQPKSRAAIKLCCNQRVVRTQVFDIQDAYPHFRILALCTAGRDEGAWRFEASAVVEHIDFYLRVLAKLAKIGRPATAAKIQLYVADHSDFIVPIQGALLARHPKVQTQVLPLAREQSYYRDIRFHLFAQNRDGNDFFLADGGLTDWTQQLLSNKKERLMISGFGSERLLACF